MAVTVRGLSDFWPSLAAQYAALAEMRWRMLLNSLRTRRGNFELAARILGIGFFSFLGLAMGVGLGFGAFEFASDGKLEFLPFLIWPVLFLWQLAPVMVASFQEHVDLSVLLRFPVSFGSYLLQYLVFGLFDISSIMGGICVAGIWTGLVCARAAPGGMGHVRDDWVCRLQSSAYTDDFCVARPLAGAEAYAGDSGDGLPVPDPGGPVIEPGVLWAFRAAFRASVTMTRSTTLHALHTADRVQSVLPPGLAAGAIHEAADGHEIAALASLGGLALYALAAGSLLGIRLRAEYRGESLGEAPQRWRRSRGLAATHFDFAGPIGAVVEKELRYLSRSGMMLYSLVAPLIMLFVLGRSGSGAGFAAHYGLPLGVAYGFLGLTRLVYNSLGGEGAGIQLYFLVADPVSNGDACEEPGAARVVCAGTGWWSARLLSSGLECLARRYWRLPPAGCCSRCPCSWRQEMCSPSPWLTG